MSKKLFFTGIFLSSLLGGLVVYILIGNLGDPNGSARKYVSFSQRQEVMQPASNPEVIVPEGLNFLEAADRVLPGVVHIESFYGGVSSDPFERYAGREPRSTGSGVIITDDGYIATNYHVVENASRVEVKLNDNRLYDAEIVGVDETTDLALIKIDQPDLPFVRFGNSDIVVPGEWVLAIGNPFNLNSTVTAGIVSAKARNINILRTDSNLQIESFIQTDAAVNPGNSGGALVNLKGELIGINTAIATASGRFEGYSFAVPVTLVEKVMNDLLEFGEVKRGLLGISIMDMDAKLAEFYDLEVVSGVYVNSVIGNSAGYEAGLREGDVIVGINEKQVSNTSELQEYVARNRPGDMIEVTFIRENLEKTVSATLRDIDGSTNVYGNYPSWDGVYFQDVEFNGENRLILGIRVERNLNRTWKDAGIENGFIITHLNDEKVNSTEELIELLDAETGSFSIEGIDLYGHSKVIEID